MADLTASPARQVLPAAAAAVTDLVSTLPADPADPVWTQSTPCSEWSVRELLNHLTAEHLWAPRLLAGETIEQVGSDYDGDVLGEDPRATWEEAITASLLAWGQVQDESREIGMSYGPATIGEYAEQMLVDLVVHGWDLAQAVGAPYDPAAEAVDVALDYERPRLSSGTGMEGLFKPGLGVPSDEPLDRLVALTGRDPGWQPRDWWKSAVVYQIYPRSFADSDGDGIGDLRGILSKVDHLAHLGVDVVWLSPVYRSPQDDNGYDISDYEDVDPMFGSLADLDELIAALHQRGIRLVMDLVVNHTSDEHAWFAESRSADSPKRDWYVWRPPRPGMVGGTPGAEPNNWRSVFSGPAWQWDEEAGAYYLHLFSRKQPDLNWEKPEVREAVYAMMRRWLERGVDGFRMDVINLISKPVGLPDGDAFDLVADGPKVHEWLAEMRREVFDRQPRAFLTVGETPAVTVEEAALYTDPARRELDMVFQFEHVDLDGGPGGKFDHTPVTMPQLRENLMAWQVDLAEVGWNSLYWDNHDQPRVVSRFGDDDPAWREASAKTLATVLHTLRGTPFVYQGEEIGMTNTRFSAAEDFRDIESVNYLAEQQAAGVSLEQLLPGVAAKSRDNARTPVQWDAGAGAGFTTGEPWIPLAPNASEINVEAQRGTEGSVLEHYCALIELRHNETAVSHGSIAPLLMEHPHLWAFERELDGTRMLTVASFTREAQGWPAELDGWEGAEVVIATSEAAAAAARAGGSLPGWESVVLRRTA